MSNAGEDFEPANFDAAGPYDGGKGGPDGVFTEGGDPSDLKALIPFWENTEDPLAWDTVEIAGKIFPGVASVRGSGLKRKVDVKKPKGSDGASLKDEGIEPAKLEITLLIYNRYFWEQLQGLMPLINPRKKGGLRRPMSIVHPLTRLMNITNIYVDGIPIPEHDKRNGFLRFKFTAIEWFPGPKPARKAAGSGGPNTADEKADLLALLESEQNDLNEAGLNNDNLGSNPAETVEERQFSDEENRVAQCNAFPDKEEC